MEYKRIAYGVGRLISATSCCIFDKRRTGFCVYRTSEDSTVNGVIVILSKTDMFLAKAAEKLVAGGGGWTYESSFGSSADNPDSPYQIWNIGDYIVRRKK